MLACLRTLLAFLPPLLLAGEASAGAFLMAEGRGQVITTAYFASARGAYGPRGRLVATRPYRKVETKAYLEYGVLDWLTFVGEGGAMDFRGAAPSDAGGDLLNVLIAEAKAQAPLILPSPPRAPHYRGLGLGAVGLRARLLEIEEFVVSLETSLRAASPAARVYLDMKDAWQVDARLQLGRAVETLGIPGFVDGQFGFRSRGQNGDEIRVDISYGLRPLHWLLLMAQSFTALAPGGAASGRLYAEQKFQLSVVVDVDARLSLQLGAVRALAGVNAPAETGALAGIWVRF